MTLHSALEDLQETTLRAFTGCLNRLEYLSGLRDKEGSYFHWGFSRVYGDLAAQKALARAHRSQLSKVLAMPIRKLVQDAEQSSEVAGISPGCLRGTTRNHEPESLAPGAGRRIGPPS